MAKRTVDVVGSALLLVFAVPVIAASALISALTFRAWPFFVQERVGRGGRPFRLVKVRTLAPSTPAQLAKPLLVDHEPPWACRFLRSHHLDELPQLVQVLTGRMSLVGPRPEMPALLHLLSPEQEAARDQVRPGITGLWQVSLAVRGLIGEHPEYDLFYVQQRTGRMDTWIVWRTVASVLGIEPITSVQDVPAWTWREAAPTGPAASEVLTPVRTAAAPGDAEVVEATSSPAP